MQERLIKSCGVSMARASEPPAAPEAEDKNDPEEPTDHALGRSRGGFSTKVHIVCDGQGHPLCFQLTPGQTHDSAVLDTLLEEANETLLDSQGEPIAWPLALAGDKGYRANWIDEYLLELNILPVIPCKGSDHREERLIEFDRQLYRQRNIVERLIGWLKESRRILSRFDKTAKNYAGFVTLAFIQRYLRLAE